MPKSSGGSRTNGWLIVSQETVHQRACPLIVQICHRAKSLRSLLWIDRLARLAQVFPGLSAPESDQRAPGGNADGRQFILRGMLNEREHRPVAALTERFHGPCFDNSRLVLQRKSQLLGFSACVRACQSFNSQYADRT